MTPKEEAIQLVDQYEHSTYSQVQGHLAKQCALIAVDKVLDFIYANITVLMDDDSTFITHYKEVKKEIEKL